MARAFQACQKELQGTSEKAAADIDRTTMQDQVTVKDLLRTGRKEKYCSICLYGGQGRDRRAESYICWQ